MKSESFTGIVESGHKQHAVEVPFNPAERWGSDAVRTTPRRRGYPVRGTVGSVPFSGYIVARSKRFWLLLEPSLERSAGIECGSRVSITLHAANESDA